MTSMKFQSSIDIIGSVLDDTTLSTDIVTVDNLKKAFDSTTLRTKNQPEALRLFDTNVSDGSFRDGIWVKDEERSIDIGIFSSKDKGVWYTEDGYNYIQVDTSVCPINNDYETACYGGGVFLIGSDNGLFISKDGKDWKELDLTNNFNNRQRKQITASNNSKYPNLLEAFETNITNIDDKTYDECQYFYDEINNRHLFICMDAIGVLNTDKLTDEGLSTCITWSSKPVAKCESMTLIKINEDNQDKYIVSLDGWYCELNKMFETDWDGIFTKCTISNTSYFNNITYNETTTNTIDNWNNDTDYTRLCFDSPCQGLMTINGEKKNVILYSPTYIQSHFWMYYSFDGKTLYPLILKTDNNNQMTISTEDNNRNTNYETAFIDHNGRLFISAATAKTGLWYTDDLQNVKKAKLDGNENWSIERGLYTVKYNDKTKLYYTTGYKTESAVYISEDGENWVTSNVKGQFYPITDVGDGFIIPKKDGGLKYVRYYSEVATVDYLIAKIEQLEARISELHPSS